MKNIIIAAVFLFSQMGYSFQKTNLINAKGYHLENEKLSSLILSKDEFSQLSDKDKTIYMFSMIALAQIVEISQQEYLGYGYQNSEATKKQKTSLYKLNLLMSTVNKAEAFWIALGKMAIEYLALEALMAGAVKLSVRSAAKSLANMPAIKKMTIEEAKLAFKTAHPNIKPNEALAIGQDAVQLAKQRVLAVEKLIKENKDPKMAKELLDIRSASRNELAASVKRYTAVYGGKHQDLKKILSKESGFNGYFLAQNTLKVTQTGLAIYGAETLFKEATGAASSQVTDDKVNSLFGFSEEKLTDYKKGDSSKSKGKDCLFGGHPSRWEKTDDFIYCKQPDASKTDNCKGEEDFQCQTYGIKLAGAPIDSKMCVSKQPLADLTFRCSQKLLTLLEENKKKAGVNEAEFTEFTNYLKEIFKTIDESPKMQDADGKTKSIGAYCFADNVSQSDVCDAVKHVMSYLKDTKHPAIIARRPTTDTPAPTPKPTDPPAPAEPASEAEGAGKS